MKLRYTIHEDLNGTWFVIDTFTDQVVVTGIETRREAIEYVRGLQ